MSLSELVAYIAHLPDGPHRDEMLDLYHALNVDRFGSEKADWYRKEYEWLRGHPPTAPEVSPRELSL
jgi:hypothetical protein